MRLYDLIRFVYVLIIAFQHSVFRTSHGNVNINETSSYVDLAPLYGNNEERLNKIRVFDGRGLIKPDTFAEDRLMLLPPAVCVLLVLFSRNHNVRLDRSNSTSVLNPELPSLVHRQQTA